MVDVCIATRHVDLAAALGLSPPGRRPRWPLGRMHEGRTHQVAVVEDLEELVNDLTQQTWTECQGFQWRGLVFLNDATSPDGAQEYPVYRADTLERVESLTVSWMTLDELREAVRDLDAEHAGRDMDAAWPDSRHQRPCRWCA